MFTTTSSFRRIAAIAGATTITCITAITTTYAAPAPATNQPERPCFISQPRWNTAIDGPAPTCPTPTWQSAAPAGGGTHNRIDFGDEYGSTRP